MEAQNIQKFKAIEIKYTQFSKKEEALKRKWNEKRAARKLSKSDDLGPTISSPSTHLKGLPKTSASEEMNNFPGPSKVIESPSVCKRAGLRSSLRRTTSTQNQQNDDDNGNECKFESQKVAAPNLLNSENYLEPTKEEALKRKWNEKRSARKLSKSDDLGPTISSLSTYLKGLPKTSASEKMNNLPGPSKVIEPPSVFKRAGLRSSSRRTKSLQNQQNVNSHGSECKSESQKVAAPDLLNSGDYPEPTRDYPKTSTGFQKLIPSRRTSTPIPLNPESAVSNPINKSYEKFRTRLENPLSKKIHRGVQLKHPSLVSSHIVLNTTPPKFEKPNFDYTYVITFPEEFNLEKFEAEENAACTSGNWEKFFENNIQHVVYYVPYVYHVPAYYSEALYYPYVQYHPYYYPL